MHPNVAWRAVFRGRSGRICGPDRNMDWNISFGPDCIYIYMYIYIYICIYISADPHLKGPSCEALRLTPSPHFQPSIPSLSYDWELLLDPIIYDHTYQLVADKEVSRKWRGASAIFYLSSRAFYDFSIIVDLLSLIFCLLCAICYLLSYDL